jgi:hypothetical protein
LAEVVKFVNKIIRFQKNNTCALKLSLIKCFSIIHI